MKKIHKILFYIIINLLMLVIGSVLYYNTLRLFNILNLNTDLYDFLAILSLFIGFVVSFSLKNKKLRKISFGSTYLFFVSISFLITLLNTKITFEGDFQSFEVVQNARFPLKNKAITTLKNNKFNTKIKTEYSENLNFDSIQIRIDKSLFGIKFPSKEFRILENKNCNQNFILKTSNFKDNFKLCQKLAYSRCFDEALTQFNLLISKDTLNNSKIYEEIANIYIAKKEYKNALLDYLKIINNKVYKIDNSVTEIKFNKEITTKDIENIDFKNIIKHIEELNIVNPIQFCAQKIKN